jgi:uncharacterized spore protein YtfJ
LVDELLERVADAVGKGARASAVFGEAVQDAGVTVIPVARTRFGFGAGGGQGRREGQDGSGGGGGGGGGIVTPIGFIEVHAAGAEFKRIWTPMDWVAVAAAASLAVLALTRVLD